MDSQQFRFFPYYLNSRRIADLTGERLPLASQRSLNQNSGERVEAMDATLVAARKLIYSESTPNLANLVATEGVTTGRVLAFVWGVFTFSGASKALQLEAAGKPFKQAKFSGKIPLGDQEYNISGPMFNEHYYSNSSLTVLTNRKRMFILGHFQFNDDMTVEVSPYIIGEIVIESFLSISYSSSVRVYPNIIDQFKKNAEVGRPNKAELSKAAAMPETAVKNAFAEIVGEPYVPKDWGGEKSDLSTSRITIDGAPTPTAFIFKGPSLKGEMHPANMGKRGDQLVRAFDEPVSLVVVQHCDKIANSVVRIAEALAYDPRNPRQYCILDGADTAHILKAYGYLD